MIRKSLLLTLALGTSLNCFGYEEQIKDFIKQDLYGNLGMQYNNKDGKLYYKGGTEVATKGKENLIGSFNTAFEICWQVINGENKAYNNIINVLINMTDKQMKELKERISAGAWNALALMYTAYKVRESESLLKEIISDEGACLSVIRNLFKEDKGYFGKILSKESSSDGFENDLIHDYRIYLSHFNLFGLCRDINKVKNPTGHRYDKNVLRDNKVWKDASTAKTSTGSSSMDKKKVEPIKISAGKKEASPGGKTGVIGGFPGFGPGGAASSAGAGSKGMPALPPPGSGKGTPLPPPPGMGGASSVPSKCNQVEFGNGLIYVYDNDGKKEAYKGEIEIVPAGKATNGEQLVKLGLTGKTGLREDLYQIRQGEEGIFYIIPEDALQHGAINMYNLMNKSIRCIASDSGITPRGNNIFILKGIRNVSSCTKFGIFQTEDKKEIKVNDFADLLGVTVYLDDVKKEVYHPYQMEKNREPVIGMEKLINSFGGEDFEEVFLNKYEFVIFDEKGLIKIVDKNSRAILGEFYAKNILMDKDGKLFIYKNGMPTKKIRKRHEKLTRSPSEPELAAFNTLVAYSSDIIRKFWENKMEYRATLAADANYKKIANDIPEKDKNIINDLNAKIAECRISNYYYILEAKKKIITAVLYANVWLKEKESAMCRVLANLMNAFNCEEKGENILYDELEINSLINEAETQNKQAEENCKKTKQKRWGVGKFVNLINKVKQIINNSSLDAKERFIAIGNCLIDFADETKEGDTTPDSFLLNKYNLPVKIYLSGYKLSLQTIGDRVVDRGEANLQLYLQDLKEEGKGLRLTETGINESRLDSVKKEHEEQYPISEVPALGDSGTRSSSKSMKAIATKGSSGGEIDFTEMAKKRGQLKSTTNTNSGGTSGKAPDAESSGSSSASKPVKEEHNWRKAISLNIKCLGKEDNPVYIQEADSKNTKVALTATNGSFTIVNLCGEATELKNTSTEGNTVISKYQCLGKSSSYDKKLKMFVFYYDNNLAKKERDIVEIKDCIVSNIISESSMLSGGSRTKKSSGGDHSGGSSKGSEKKPDNAELMEKLKRYFKD